MLRKVQTALGFVVGVSCLALPAEAQYYPGYGGYGWGGWGSGVGTVQGSIARGLGYYNAGAGIYNLDTAEANSINEDTVARWNEFLFLSQQEANRREYFRMARREKRDSKSGDLVYQRLRDNPTPADIANGDALNVVLDQITDPRIHSSALRLATDALSSSAIADIPFEIASSAITVSLHQYTAKDAWPQALQDDAFAPERRDWQEAVAQALKEDEAGKISAPTLAAVRGVASRLRAKLEANPPTDRQDLMDARNYVKSLIGLARMLSNPQLEKVLAELEKTSKTSLGSLLGFMHTYNLRFGPATTAEQRAIYENLYPQMVGHRDRVYKETGIPTAPPAPQARSTKGRPSNFFQGMHLDHLEGKSAPGPATK